MNEKKENSQVIIIGAGPVGLLAAITLAKAGVKVRIFEKLKKRCELSRALAIHSGTLEYLEEVNPNLLSRFLARGKKIEQMKFGEKYHLNTDKIPSRYNFVLALEQEETEEILEEFLLELDCKVERDCELIDAKNAESEVEVTIKSGKKEFKASANYLLDCSGAHSIIRKNILQLSFKGEKYFGKIVMADIKVNSALDEHSGYVTRNKKGIAGFLPLNTKSHFRVILIPQTKIEIPEEISIDYFLNLAKEIVPQIELDKENKWLTKFEISKRVVDKLCVGRIFLAGDAAHIHSPVGGQGMNLGMQDALNISIKLKKVLIDGVNEKILNAYEKQRLPIIKDVLKATNSAMKSGVEVSFLAKVRFFFIQKIAAPILFRSKFLQKRLLIKLSQIKSARKEISWSKS